MSYLDPDFATVGRTNFQAALLRLLETDYGRVGSRRVLTLLVEDILALQERFFPGLERLGKGTLIWTGAVYEGRKARAGEPIEKTLLATVALPYFEVEEDGPGVMQVPRRDWLERDYQRFVRMVRAAYDDPEGPVVLTIAEWSLILNRHPDTIRKLVQKHREQTGQELPLKGYVTDQGCWPSHRQEIITRHEGGELPPSIAHQTNHSLQRVESYIGTYERLRLLLQHGLTGEEANQVLHLSEHGLRTYLGLVYEHHPELQPASAEADPTGQMAE